MLHGILQHLKATYVTLEFAALTHLILMEAGQGRALWLAQTHCQQLCIFALLTQEI